MISHYLELLNSTEVGFQTVVTSMSSLFSKPSLGLAHFQLRGANSK
jgi:hypothetical protein